MKVLILASYFDGQSTGSLRMCSLTERLVKKGHEVVVMTTDVNAVSIGSKVYIITDSIEKYFYKYKFGKLFYQSLRKSLYCLFGIEKHFLYKGFLKSKEFNFDAIIASSPQPELLEIGLLLQDRFNSRLIVDFRDGLIFEPLRSYNLLERYRYKILEAKSAVNSDVIVGVSNEITNYFKNEYKVDKAITVSNGFSKWNDSPYNVIESGLIKIVYTGGISKSRSNLANSMYQFLGVYDSLPQEVKERLDITFVGDLTDEETRLLGERFTVLGKVQRDEALKIQNQADYLLLFTGLDKSVLTGKLFEYLSTRKPIVALTSGGSVDHIIESTGSGVCFDHENNKALFNYFSQMEKQGFLDRVHVEGYHRDRINLEFEKALDVNFN